MPIDKLFGSLNISASGLTAQRRKLDIISENIANANTTRTEEGGPYRRKIAVIKEKNDESFRTVFERKSHKLAVSNPAHISGAPRMLSTDSRSAKVEAEVKEDQSELTKVYDPNHPDADEEGYVYLPNVNMISEMIDMISASRSYEANLSAIDAAKKMAKSALEI